MADCVLDASAILAILFDEPGREIAMTAAGDAAVSALTVAEVATRLIDTGQSLPGIAEIVAEFEFAVHAVGSDEAFDIAGLRDQTRRAGLSMGDRGCLALARRLGLPAITADRAWSRVADELGVEVRLIR